MGCWLLESRGDGDWSSENDAILPTGNRTDHKKRLVACDHRIGKSRIRCLVRQVFLAGKVSEKGATLERRVVANRAAEHREPLLDRVYDRPDGHRTSYFDLDLFAHLGKGPQVLRKYNSNHILCSSTSWKPAPLCKHLDLDRKHTWKVAHNGRPAIPFVDRRVHLTTRRPEVQSARIM